MCRIIRTSFSCKKVFSYGKNFYQRLSFKMKVFFLKGLDSKPDLENNVCVSPSTTITPSNIESPESPKPEAHTEHDENASTQPLSPEPEDMDTMKKIKSSSSGNEDETEVDVLEMDDEISDEKFLNAMREADRYGKKK
jgi:hypothetical protein